MSTASSLAPNRRGVLFSAVAASAATLFFGCLAAAGDTPLSQPSKQGDSSMDTLADTAQDNAIRPFSFTASDDGTRGSPSALGADAVAREGDRHPITPQGPPLKTIQTARCAIGRPNTTGERSRRGSMPCRISSPKSTGWTSTSSTFVQSTTMRCRSSSRTAGPAR